MTVPSIVNNVAYNVGRECGSCDLCCVAFPVPGIKGEHGKCRFARSGTATVMEISVGEFGVDFAPTVHPQFGCGIYARRPRPCVQFYCGWRLGLGEDHERPDKTGIVLIPAGSGSPDQAAVGVQIWLGPGSLYPDREELLKRALAIADRVEAGTMGAAHGWPAMPIIGGREGLARKAEK